MKISVSILFTTLLFPFLSQAQQDLCRLNARSFQKRLSSPENRLSFANPAGPLNIGLCWWHSRFQRNAVYLFENRPQKRSPPANPQAALEVIKDVIGLRRITAPGNATLSRFSATYQREITEALGQWQMADSFLRFGWMNGLQGKVIAGPERLLSTMGDLKQKVDRGQIVFQMLQVKGPNAHAWLVYDLKNNPLGGLDLSTVDSNEPSALRTYSYQPGMSHLHFYLGDFSPVTQREGELQSAMKTLARDCRQRSEPSPLEKQMTALFGGDND